MRKSMDCWHIVYEDTAQTGATGFICEFGLLDAQGLEDKKQNLVGGFAEPH